jgi:hypothetical protein
MIMLHTLLWKLKEVSENVHQTERVIIQLAWGSQKICPRVSRSYQQNQRRVMETVLTCQAHKEESRLPRRKQKDD